ncbi:MAG: hypothetical protein HC824_07075 [Synechococcales cyanobacterium RM1_1_8]|nr:hypothetical protein [Synechococcales cyanobacterium RM1_1_8]
MTRPIEVASTAAQACPQGSRSLPAGELWAESPTESIAALAPTFQAFPQPSLGAGSSGLGALGRDRPPSPHDLAGPLPQPRPLHSSGFLVPPISPASSLQLQPFALRLAHRRQAYVPLSRRTPWQSLAGLGQGGLLEFVALMDAAGMDAAGAAPDPFEPAIAHWALARVPGLTLPFHPGCQLQAYLRMAIAPGGDITLDLMPGIESQRLLAAVPLAMEDHAIAPFQLLAQASFIDRLEQLRQLPLQLQLQFETAISLYRRLQDQPLGSAQAKQYFDRLLDRSPLAPSATPASDRLLQRRSLLQAFVRLAQADAQATTAQATAQTSAQTPNLWHAYGAVADWLSRASASSPGSGPAASGWLAGCQGPQARLLHLAQELALTWRPADPQPTPFSSRRAGVQRSLEASGALQARVQRLRAGAIAPPTLARASR